MNIQIKEYTVTEITNAIKNAFDRDFSHIKIKGEIANFKRHEASGHCYFDLKDRENRISMVMFKGNALRCSFIPCDGMEIVASGRISIYKSKYSLNIENMHISGEGAILKLLQERKARLEKEGLFDPQRKRPIKRLPSRVALITAENGAALQDVLVRLKGRTPIQNLYLYNSLMQGATAPSEIIRGIEVLNTYDLDVIVITRGGGSMEDLMAFNDEVLVRAVAASKIPIISAVGHEIDWTLIDYASDLRLPTPTSVAECLTIPKEQALKRLYELFRGLVFKRFGFYKSKQNRIVHATETLKKAITRRANRYRNNLEKIRNVIRNFIRRRARRYLQNKNFIRNININAIIRVKFLCIENKLKNLILKLYKYEQKFPILTNLSGKQIKLRAEMAIENEYILVMPDGMAKIRVIGLE